MPYVVQASADPVLNSKVEIDSNMLLLNLFPYCLFHLRTENNSFTDKEISNLMMTEWKQS